MELPLIVPERLGVQSELANWLGADFHKIQDRIYQVISAPIQELWHSMVSGIQYRLRQQFGIGGKIFSFRKDSIQKSQQIL